MFGQTGGKAGLCAVLGWLIMLLGPASVVHAQASIEVSRLELRYAETRDGLPLLSDVLSREVVLAERDGVFDAPRNGDATRRVRLFELARDRVELTSDGLDAVLAAIESSLAEEGFAGFVARPNQAQFTRADGVWRDRRVFNRGLSIEILPPLPPASEQAPETEPEPAPEPAAAVMVAVAAAGVDDSDAAQPAASPRMEIISSPGAAVIAEPDAAANPDGSGPPLPPNEPAPFDGEPFQLPGIELRYTREHPQQPALGDLMNTEVELTRTSEGWVAARTYGPVQSVSLHAIGADGPVVMFASALDAIPSAIVERFNEQSIVGVFVQASPDTVTIIPDRDGGLGEFLDERLSEDEPFVFEVSTAIVSRIGSSAAGDRIPIDARIDHPHHRRVRENSPLTPFTLGVRPELSLEPGPMPEGDDEPPASVSAADVAAWEAANAQRNDLLREDVLNDYALRLNRHPGRTVDIAIAPGDVEGEAELQYIIREDKPWTVFAQLSNTGTESTEEFRQRFGFVNTQLTNSDDILSIDYTTASFDAANAVSLSYDRPIIGIDTLRFRVSGGYSEFSASDVGSVGETFEGESFFFNAELVGNVYQRGELFIDAFIGARYQNIEVTDLSVGASGPAEEAIFLPRVGARLQRFGAWSSITASTTFEWSVNDLTGASEDGLEQLGRINPEFDWFIVAGDVTASVFLEPLLNLDGWNDPSTPESSTLAHELAFRFAGQYAFNQRLIPNAEGVVGGLFTVRGYPESVVAGDSTYFGSIEYRFHVPRVLGINPEPSTLFGRPFRVSPQQVYGFPDWDLVLKAFFDFGETSISQPLGFETGETLSSVGVGVDLQIYRNLSFRADWGFVLSSIGSEESGIEVDSGDSRAHLLFTVAY